MPRKHKSHRPSNSDIRAMTYASLSFDEFVNGRPVKVKSEEPVPLPIRPQEVSFSFIGGKTYFINDTPKQSSDERNYLVYLRKEGKHHMFRNYLGGWITCFTDPQLIGKTITELK